MELFAEVDHAVVGIGGEGAGQVVAFVANYVGFGNFDYRLNPIEILQGLKLRFVEINGLELINLGKFVDLEGRGDPLADLGLLWGIGDMEQEEDL